MNNVSDTQFAPTEKKKKEYSLSDTIVALILFFIGYLVSRWSLNEITDLGLGTLLLILIIAIISILYMKAKNIKVDRKSAIQLAFILVLALPLLLSANGFIKFLVSSYFNISFVYWFFCTCKNREEEQIGDMLLFDILKSTLVLPFSCFSDIFSAIGNYLKDSSFGKKILFALLGIIIAIIPTAIVTMLLINADEAFENLTSELFSNSFSELPKHIMFFLFGIPIAMYIFGMMYANTAHEKKESLTREINEKNLSLVRFLPTIITCASITPVIIVYSLFFFSQTSYFLSAFSGIRPENITFAQYARKGFFELCGVSVINVLIIIVANLFTKRTDNKKSPAVRGYIATLSVFTIVLIAIALSKMFMYIDAYGLSPLRIYTTWFMVLLALLFVYILIKQFSGRFNLFRTFTISFIIMFALLVFADTDAITAKYNVERYTSGVSDSVDIYMMYDLSDSAVKYIIPLANDKNPEIAQKAKEYLNNKKLEFDISENSFVNFNIATCRAKKAVEEYYQNSN